MLDPVPPRSARTNLPPLLDDVVLEATGRTHGDDPSRPVTGGPAGNARLTAWTGLVLLALFLAELVTLLDVRGLISWHIVVGTLLIPPALLKTASTGWRIACYYRREPHYHQAGPPPMLLRIIGPGVVLSTLGLLGSGVLLVLLGPASSRSVIVTALGQRVDWITVHQGLFIGWAVLTGLHVLARVVPAVRMATGGKRRVPGGARRMGALLVALVAAVVLAAVVLAASGSWRSDPGHRDRPTGGFRQSAPR
ncbi:MAG: hypothetical protein M3P23_06890 [Actinomycetota bacterium]|nr:hypothetical protein [Actinomycetota bacterium]